MSTVNLLTEPVTLSTYISSLEPQWGDLILIEHPPQPMQNESLYELFIADTHRGTSPADLDLLIIPPENWVLLQMAVIRDRVVPELTMGSLRLAPRIPRDRIIDDGARIHLRPSSRAIRGKFFGGKCPYERCQHGIVLVTPSSSEALGLLESSREAHLTLCPICMGLEILRQHEGLVKAVADAPMMESTTEELFRDASIRGHRWKVNDIRLEMGYAVLPRDPGLYGLGVQPDGSTEEIEIASLGQYLDSVAHAARGSPATETIMPITDVSQALTRTARREGHITSARRGRAGRRVRGPVAFRRLDMDRRPGSGHTYEVSLGDGSQLAEATIRIQDYHRTLMEPPSRLTLQMEERAAAARNITEGNQGHLQETAAMRVLDGSNPIRQVSRPGTPMPPALPDRPRVLYGSVICSEPFSWYRLVQERVIDEICAICLERFENLERIGNASSWLITALPCGHFYHDECIRGGIRERTIVSCPYRCEGLVRM